ncbi:MAG: hypothetical protein ABSA97_15895, partial [Verrucomicrobiia bacterium]
MSEVIPNSVSNELEASQTGTTGETTSQSAASAQVNLDTQPTPQPIPNPQGRTGKREFSSYTRSLLRVRVPVVVTLAEKKQTLG